MPLRAFVDGKEMIAPLMSDDEWEALRARVTAENLLVVLPCCRREGYLRRSAGGTPHFAHKRGGRDEDEDREAAPRCVMAGETLQHITAKSVILRACEAVGYTATPEAVGEGWRADILAVRGAGRIAFEVQWSNLKLHECEERQRRYADDGVRGCWFFRRPPPGLFQHDRLIARRDLPLFQLFVNADFSFSVGLNDRLYGLGDFVDRLLRGRIRYCEHARAAPKQRLRLVFFPMTCPACGSRAHLYTFTQPLVAHCGVPLPVHSLDWYRLAFHPQVRTAVARFLQSPDGVRYKLGAIKPRTSRTSGETYTSFGCPTCDSMFDREDVGMALLGSRRLLELEAVSALDVEVQLRDAFTLPFFHWCSPEANGFCCG